MTSDKSFCKESDKVPDTDELKELDSPHDKKYVDDYDDTDDWNEDGGRMK